MRKKRTSTQIDSQTGSLSVSVCVRVSPCVFLSNSFYSGSLICKQTVKRVKQQRGKIHLHHHHHRCHESRAAVLSNSQCVLPVLPVRLSVYCPQTEAAGSQTRNTEWDIISRKHLWASKLANKTDHLSITDQSNINPEMFLDFFKFESLQ